MDKVKFENALFDLFCNSSYTPREVYRAITRNTWVHDERNLKYRVSDRHAALTLANMVHSKNVYEHDNNFYNLYCSGNEGDVTPAIRTALSEKGWRVA